jgi:hypothetical protein
MSSIVQPPTASANQPPATPPPVAAAATGTTPPASATPVEAQPSSDITITSTTDTPEQVAAALKHEIHGTPTLEQQTAALAAVEAAKQATAAETQEPPIDAAAASAAASTLAKRKKSGMDELKDRVDQLTYEREENRRAAEQRAAEAAAHAAEAARLKAENDALRAGKPVPGQPTTAKEAPKKPELKDFEGQPDPYAAFSEAVGQWAKDLAVFETNAELDRRLSTRDKADQDRQTQAQYLDAQERTFAAHKARVEQFRAATPGYDDTVSKAMQAIKDSEEGVFAIPPVLQEHILHTETGPALFFHLAQDQKEFRRIASIEKTGPMLVALGRYEAKLESQGKLAPKAQPTAVDPATRARDALTSSSSAAAAVTTAPPPPPLVGSGTTASTVPLDQLDYQDYAKQRNAQERARRR